MSLIFHLSSCLFTDTLPLIVFDFWTLLPKSLNYLHTCHESSWPSGGSKEPWRGHSAKWNSISYKERMPSWKRNLHLPQLPLLGSSTLSFLGWLSIRWPAYPATCSPLGVAQRAVEGRGHLVLAPRRARDGGRLQRRRRGKGLLGSLGWTCTHCYI